MKKSLQLLVTGALFAAGAMTASADRYYQEADVVDYSAIEPGVQYVLNNGAHVNQGAFAYLSGTSFTFSQYLRPESFVTFEVAGKSGEFLTYYLKNSEGLYLTAPGRALGYTENKDNAWVLTVKPVVDYAEDVEDYTAEDGKVYTKMDSHLHQAMDAGEEFDFSCASYVYADGGVVIASAEPDDATDPYSTYTYLQGLENGNATSGNITRGSDGWKKNVWVIYTVERQSALQYLEAVKSQLFGENEWNPDDYGTGGNPGDYDADKIDAVTELVEASYDADEDTAEAIADALLKAYEEFKASFVNFGEGYYVFTTFRSSTGALFDNTGNVAGAKANMYTTTDPAVAITHTEVGGKAYSIGDWDVYDPYDDDAWMGHAAAPYFIWKVTSAGNGMFYVQNWKTGQYIGGAPKNADGSLKKSNAPILMTKNPEASYNMKPSTNYNDEGVLCWQFYSDELTKVGAWGGGWAMGGLHAPGDVLNMVTWDSEADGSCWVPRTITEEDLAKIEQLNVQATLNFNLQHLVDEAKTTIDGTKAEAFYNGDVKVTSVSDMSKVDGLVTSVEQIRSNASDSAEGKDLSTLVDGKPATFWHSNWHAGEDPDDGYLHCLDIDLQKVVDTVTFKLASRNGNINGVPYMFNVYGSNDGENWEEISLVTEEEVETGELNESGEPVMETQYNGGATVTWMLDRKAIGAGGQTNAIVGYFTTKAGYSHIRLENVHAGGAWIQEGNTYRDAKGNAGMPYFNISEIRAYEGELTVSEDLESVYYAVPEDVRKNVEDALATAEEELEDEAATQPTIDALQKALDAFKAATPDPQSLLDLISAAKDLYATAEVGTKPGYFAQDALDALQAAITAAEGKYKTNMSIDAVTEAKAALQAAIDAFQAALIKPEAGYYVIRSKALKDDGNPNDNTDAIMYVQNSSRNTPVQKGYNTEKTNEYAERVAGSYWQVEKAEGGFTFKNVYSGLYLAPVGPESEVVAQSETPYVFALQFAQVAGCFNIVIAEEDAAHDGKYIYVNAQPGGGVVTWSSAKGNDNSAWAFEPADDKIEQPFNDGFVYKLEVPKAPQIVTFPFNLYIDDKLEVKFYNVKGQNDNYDIQLEETEEVVAGQAYVLVPETDEAYIRFFAEAEEFADFTTTRELKDPVHGLQGVFDETKVPKGYGVFTQKRDKVTVSEGTDDDKVVANSGFFGLMPATTEKGDAFIPAAGAFADLTGISTVITNSDVQKGIFSISGVRMNNINNLPAGLYIINGKKIVK